MKQRVAIYGRVSRFTEESTTVKSHQEACENYARSQFGSGVDIDHYSDVDRSGYDPDVEREAFREMLDNVARYDALVVYRLDRLTRQGARHMLEIVEDHLRPNGVRFMSVTEPIDTEGQFAELFTVLLSTFAKMESERISERTLGSQRYLRQQGYWAHGQAPYGFELAETGDGHKRLAVVEEEAAIIREAVERVTAGEALTQVADDTPLTSQGLRKLLKNPALAGYQTQDGDILYGEDGEPVTVGEAIIDASTHYRLVEMLSADNPQRADRKYLLTGVLVCGECGYGMSGRTESSGRAPQYVCHGGLADRDCPGNVASMRQVERVVTEWVKRELPDVAQRGHEVDARAEDDDQDAQLAHLSNLQRQLEEQIDTLLLEEGLDYEDGQVQRLDKRARKVQSQRAQLLEERRQRERSQEPEWLGDVEAIADRFDALDVDAQRELILTVVDEIPVRKADSPGGTFDDARVVLPEVD